MKLKCVYNKIDVSIFGIIQKLETIKELTILKIYTCFFDSESGKFLVYNDKKKWEYYPIELFEPIK